MRNVQSTPAIFSQSTSYLPSGDGDGVTGIVYWNCGNGTFPDPKWNDFVLVLACWWLGALDELEVGATHSQLMFMDGPFRIDCHCEVGDVVCEAVDGRRGSKIVSTWRLPIQEFAKTIRQFSSQVLNYCDQAGIRGDDVNNLRRRLQPRTRSKEFP